MATVSLTTERIPRCIADLQYDDLPETAKEKLHLLLLDYIGVAAAATQLGESSKPILAAVENLDGGGGGGKATAIANGQRWSALYAALLNGAFAHTLDFDDTHADGILHPGASVISAALAEAEVNEASSAADFFTALAAGYEVTCRLAVAIGPGGSSLGFHNTSTAGIFGAVTAIAKLRNATATTIENAFGIALSKASGSMQFLNNGSWNKRLHPGFAAHDAFICVSLAESGVVGAAEPIEGRFGLLNVFSRLRNNGVGRVDLPFKEHWEFLATAVKPYPACRGTHGPIELASQMSKQNPSRVKSITVYMAKEHHLIVGEATPRKIHPQNIVDAQFSVFHQIAVAWIYGVTVGWKVYDHLENPEVSGLREKVKVEIQDSFKVLETQLSVEWDDGTGRKSTWPVPRLRLEILCCGMEPVLSF